MLNGRPVSLVARNILQPSNYRALVQAFQTYERPVHDIARYFLGSGSYPCTLELRSPIGPQSVTLFCAEDAITVHEIFCRGDYSFPPPTEVVVDIGSNIGISALYFLTRSLSAYCYLHEPDPRNLEKLRANLSAFADRFTLSDSAVADESGSMPFHREPTGRYGTLGVPKEGSETLTVQVEHINLVLERVLGLHDRVDLLKIDSEGSELATIRAIDPRLLRCIRYIVIESRNRTESLTGFRREFQCDTVRFTNKALTTVF